MAELCANTIQYQVGKKSRENSGYSRSHVSGRDGFEQGNGTAFSEQDWGLGLQGQSHFIARHFTQCD